MSRRSPKRRWKQWSEAEARAALSEWKKSGASASEFARHKSVSVKRLHYWKKRLAQTDGVAFVPVVAPARHDARIEIERAGIVVRVREGLGDEHLTRILAALAGLAAPC